MSDTTYYLVQKNTDGTCLFHHIPPQHIIEQGHCTLNEDGTPKQPLEVKPPVYPHSDVPDMLYNVYPVVLEEDGATIREMTDAELQPYKEAYERVQLQEQVEEIDRETGQQFTYFEYDGHTFSLSQNAQINWGELAILDDKGWFGDSQIISTHQDGEYELLKENLDGFLQAYAQAKMSVLSQGRSKKQDLLNPV